MAKEAEVKIEIISIDPVIEDLREKYRLSNETTETLNSLWVTGVKWTIFNKVDRRFELHNEVERFDGKVQVMFVAEVDGYGNIVEWGNDEMNASSHLDNRPYFLTTDGEQIRAI